MKTTLNLTLVFLLVLATGCSRDGNKSGRTVIQNKGSDTIVNVAQAWAEAYREVSPDVAVAVTGGGSGTGIASVINGTVDIANSSRQMKEEEIDLAKKNGQNPQEYVVGFDALAIFVHPTNPLKDVSIAQLRDIYGESGTAVKWTDIGITVPGCKDQEIVRVSRQNNSGTYQYFQESVLGEGNDFKLGSRDMHGSKDVVDLVAHTVCAIGYSGLAYANDEVAMPCVTVDGGACVAPSIETAVSGEYPIARPLFMYTANPPVGEIKNYMDWVLGDAGQCLILNKGYAPARPVSCGN
jgi:phosphate transport system substrate-binding protein